MPRKARRRTRPLPVGAVFVLLILAITVGVILWRTRREERPSGQAPVGPPAKVVEQPVVVPPGLPVLLGRYLADRRLQVVANDGGCDLLCKVPAGYSLFELNGELTEVVRRLGGRAEKGEEGSDAHGARWVDLRLTREGESCSLRLFAAQSIEQEGAIALVIDDFGYQSQGKTESFLDLPFPFTPAVLPCCPRSAWTVQRSLEKQRRPILHLPMEPLDCQANDPGTGALLVGMEPESIKGLVTAHLDELAGVVGVNHHMGSRASAEAAVVGPALDVIADHGLFYLDSGTSTASVCPLEAVGRGVRCLRADLFLDADPHPTEQTRRDRLRETCRLARANGSAIAIAHARPATLQFLESAADSVSAWGCRIVPIDTLLR